MMLGLAEEVASPLSSSHEGTIVDPPLLIVCVRTTQFQGVQSSALKY